MSDTINTTRFFEFENIPGLFICTFGAATNFCIILVFTSPKLKEPIFKYMLILSISDLVYCSLASVENLARCRTCHFYTSYFRQVYSIYIINYFTSCLAIFNVFIDLVISIERCLIITNNKCLRNVSTKLILSIIFVVALLYYLPMLFIYDIKSSGNNNVYKLETTQFARTIGNNVLIVLHVARLIFSIIILPLMNIITAWRLQRLFKKRSLLRRCTG